MRKTPLIAATTFAVGALLFMTACSSSPPQSTAAPEGSVVSSEPIVGEWTMSTLEMQNEGEFETVPFGGQIIFTEAGTVSVQAQNPDPAASDTPYTVQGYEAYYGDAVVDDAAGTVTFDVTSAAVRDLIGETLVRNFEVTDDTLVLTPVDESEGWRVTYDRAGA